ncbi:MAG TPA: hypothetical protein VG713_01150 [Pirellulales bacterium]|nr:hypothetical protein [Pirellulales bacterium]
MPVCHVRRVGLTALLLLLACQAASATPPVVNYDNNTLNIGTTGTRYRPQRPTVSPYIAMTQNTGSTAFINYFTITQPLFSQQQNNRRQGQELQMLEREVQAQQPDVDPITGQRVIRSTGHHTGFMTHRQYFGGVSGGKSIGITRQR